MDDGIFVRQDGKGSYRHNCVQLLEKNNKHLHQGDGGIK